MWELFRWFRRLQLWATGDWQLHHDGVLAHASRLLQSFLVKHQITQVTQPPYSPDLVALWLLAFPKTKITFEREEISDHPQDSGKYNKTANGDWKAVWCPKVPTLEGSEVSLSYVQCFLYLVSSWINVSIFISCGWICARQSQKLVL